MAEPYISKCAECGAKIMEPPDTPVYVVILDKYFCSTHCWNKWRKREQADG